MSSEIITSMLREVPTEVVLKRQCSSVVALEVERLFS